MKAFELFAEVQDELKMVEAELSKIVKAPDEQLTATSAHLLHAGGKRLRPAFALLAAKITGENIDKVLPIAVALELIHMASLVHDDVIDASMTRRGIPTVKAKWGNRVSMHTGDYIFAKSLQLISQYKDPRIARVLAEVSVQMCKGEIQQIVSSFDVHQNLRDYFYRIKRKTALLISASCQCGAIACCAPEAWVKALSMYGHHLGMAFQITDDILDLIADQEELGKPIGGDLRQGIMTLPIIYGLIHSPQKERLLELVKMREKSETQLKEAIELIKASGAIEYSFNLSDRFIKKSLEHLARLPEVPIRNTLGVIASFINLRRY
ncbi:MAG: polyprenyl synthetase family protein [Carboxydocellales bacterium]